MTMPELTTVDINDHSDALPSQHRFPVVTFRGTAWDFGHLAPFAFRADIGKDGAELWVDVVVFFACHCFTRDEGGSSVHASEYYDDGREIRVLCEERYLLSRRFLPRLIKELFSRHIRVASSRPNYITIEGERPALADGLYAVFFEVKKDSRRKKRLILRVESAYRVDELTPRQKNAGKVNFDVLLRATYEGRKIKG